MPITRIPQPSPYLLAAITAAAVALTAQAATPANPPANSKAQIAHNYGKLPLSFEANDGQSDPRVKFLSRGAGYNLFLTNRAAVLSLSKGKSTSNSGQTCHPERSAESAPPAKLAPPCGAQSDTIEMQLANANSNAQVQGTDQLPGTANYFLGNDPKNWHTNVPTYAKVKYTNVYSGIDLVYYGNQRQLEYDFIVQPYADPKSIQLHFAGAQKLKLTPNGDLEVIAKNGQIAFHKPVVYQTVDGIRKPVEGSFALAANRSVSFALGSYDHSTPLVIDPTLGYSTYLGGTGTATEQGYAITVDATGATYIVGETTSSSFPTSTGAVQTGRSGNPDVFITKLSASGSSLVYSTYLGGSGYDNHGRGIAVDSSGDAYVVGYTFSPDFPTTSRAYQPKVAGNYDAFVTKLNPTGTELIYSTFFGGYFNDFGEGIAIDSSGNAFITGWTNASPGYFPTTSGAYQTATKYNGGNAFIARFSADGSSLAYSTLLGGSGSSNTSLPAKGGDLANSIALDTEDNAYVAGVAGSTDFPTTTGAFQTVNNSKTSPACDNGFAAKINARGTELLWSTYLGGSGSYDTTHKILYCDQVSSMKMDAAGNLYLAGTTGSSDFPTTKGAFLTKNPEVAQGGFSTGFVTKLDSTGSKLVYSTYLGGSDGTSDRVNSLAVDSSGDAYLTGSTFSATFPVTSGALQSANPGANNLTQSPFVTKLNSSGSALIYSTYFGGNDGDVANAIAIDASGNPFFTGQTCSTDFPVSKGAFQPVNNEATCTAFVAKIDLAPNTPAATATTLAASPDPAVEASSVTFIATVRATSGSAIPTGNVVFTIDGKAEPAVALKSTGTATFTTSSLAVGSHTVTAAYGGATAFLPSTSGSVTEKVNPPSPVLSPAAGTYTKAVTVTLTDSDKSAILYYTVNGTTPTPASTKYTAPFSITASSTVKAIAVDGGLQSGVASATYTIESVVVATPVIAPTAGTYTETQTVTITDAIPAATIHYTTNGSAPAATSPVYSGPIAVTASETIKAIALANGDAPSAIATAVFDIVGSPTALASPATALTSTSATLNAIVDTLGLTGTCYFQYGTSSTELTTTTPKITLGPSHNPVAPTAKLTGLKADTKYYFQVVVSTAGGSGSSAVISFTTGATAAATPEAKTIGVFAPTFSPAAGTYATAQTVKLTSATPGAVICYSTNGIPPNSASCTRYNGPFTVSKSETVDAIAVASGRVSATSSARYTIE